MEGEELIKRSRKIRRGEVVDRRKELWEGGRAGTLYRKVSRGIP